MSPAEPPRPTGPGRARLRRAFLESAYGPPGARLRLSPTRGSPPAWVRRGESWAILTAWNPGAQQRGSGENLHAHAELLALLGAAGLQPVAALNGSGAWAEASLLLPGASMRQTLDWTRAFGQAAALWGVGERAALLWADGQTERGWAVGIPEDQG